MAKGLELRKFCEDGGSTYTSNFTPVTFSLVAQSMAWACSCAKGSVFSTPTGPRYSEVSCFPVAPPLPKGPKSSPDFASGLQAFRRIPTVASSSDWKRNQFIKAPTHAGAPSNSFAPPALIVPCINWVGATPGCAHSTLILDPFFCKRLCKAYVKTTFASLLCWYRTKFAPLKNAVLLPPRFPPFFSKYFSSSLLVNSGPSMTRAALVWFTTRASPRKVQAFSKRGIHKLVSKKWDKWLVCI
mmetsp:Transcript_3429/g.6016  ORF Transcript_3429/g.6016 Transcript_3429/m.6016 type:complete len:242 (-) Transcript_3429:406-1131(-)